MPLRRLTRGLRFQLTASYGAFFTLLMLVLAFIFRGYLSSSIDQQITDGLNQDWAALKGYLKIESNGDGTYTPNWYADYDDVEEAAIVGHLRSLYIITDEKGHVMQSSPSYVEQFGIDPPSRITNVLKTPEANFREVVGKDGRPYMIRAGFVYNEQARDENHQRKYFVAIGRSVANPRNLLRQFTWLCLFIIPVASIAGCLLGWITAGRALSPVLEVARTAQRLSGSNLSMRIPLRGARDELDFLIATFNQMIGRLETSFTQIRQFSIDVSHELRTPITIIRGQMEVALFTAQTVDQYRDAIVSSLQDIERMSQIVRALLLLSQAETGQVVLQKSLLDLSAIVTEITEQFEIPAEGAQVKLSVSGTDEPLPIEVDRVQIERMLSNLLSNAVKFTPEGGEVRVKLIKRESHAELIVEDTGVGIPADHLPHIFDRFYRVSSPSASASPEKGLGLGLSFVAWIAKAHGGSVNVESEPGKGTRFIILLPAGGAMSEPGNEQNLIATHS
jgi:heavy metal sensor kinase